jgi:tRNA nucleotidyltransferase (CCA-adding enzyme)
MVLSMYEIALNLLNEISNNGYDAYIIGGYPRNMLLGKKNTDIDICTNAKPDIIKNLFKVIKDNSEFGSVKIEYKSFIFEITSFRVELEYRGRYPKIEYTELLSEDLKRRDFTINTICIDKNGNIIDLIDARKDLNNKIIKCIGDSKTKLIEDPIRILRAIRFSSELDFELDKDLEYNIKIYGYLLETLSKNQIKKELDKMNNKAINLLKKYELINYLKGMI